MENFGYTTEDGPCCAGCNGGDYDAGFDWIKQGNRNLILENDWKYKPDNGTCEYESKDLTRVTISDYYDVPQNSSSALMTAVAQQPVAVSLDASNFRNYFGGIYDDVDCFTVTNHGVTVVGFGVDATSRKYWIVKNSWSTAWGEGGYIRILNNEAEDRGICGINEYPSYAMTVTSP